MQKWKQKLGTKATYNSLIKVFKQAGYETYAEFVESLVKNMQTDTEDSNRNAINQSPPPPLQPPLPVFPSEFEQFSESPYATAAGVKILQEDYQLGTKEAVRSIIIIPCIHYLDDTSIKINITVKIVPTVMCIQQLNHCFIISLYIRA